ncbi:unnamed protein product, partial [Didymodactylos carnosus]
IQAAEEATVVIPKRNRQNISCTPRKRRKCSSIDDNLTANSNVQPIPGYQLRDRSSVIKTADDNMVSYDSTDNEEDDYYGDDELLLNEKVLQFLKFKDQHNITDEPIRIFNILENEYGILPYITSVKKIKNNAQ